MTMANYLIGGIVVDVSQIIYTSNNTACDDIQSRFHAIIILEF